MNYAIFALIGVVLYMVFRKEAAIVPKATEPSDVVDVTAKTKDTLGKKTSFDGDGNAVVIDPPNKKYVPPPDDTKKKVILFPTGTVPKTPVGEYVPLLPERVPAVTVAEEHVRADPGAPAYRRVISGSEANAYRAEKEGIAVYEPDAYLGMRSFFLNRDPGHFVNDARSKEIYRMMYGDHYLSKLTQTGKVAENMEAKNVVPHRVVRPADRRAQYFIYDGGGHEVIWDEQIQKVVLPAA